MSVAHSELELVGGRWERESAGAALRLVGTKFFQIWAEAGVLTKTVAPKSTNQAVCPHLDRIFPTYGPDARPPSRGGPIGKECRGSRHFAINRAKTVAKSRFRDHTNSPIAGAPSERPR